MKTFENAEIYLTVCTHPDFKDLKYIGLDTKKDPKYLGSSVVLKWFIKYLGRKHFRKTVLSKVTGGMEACCLEEQRLIEKHNAVNDPSYLNMSGKRYFKSSEDRNIDMNIIVRPTHQESSKFSKSIQDRVKEYSSLMMNFSRATLIDNIVCMLCYGFICYGQSEFFFDKYKHYGSCTSSDLSDILDALESLDLIAVESDHIILTDYMMSLFPEDIDTNHFTTKFRSTLNV